ncbi:MAG: hypothetical protein II736_07915, partial [Clostridia bacterium]|nr:hypothetical protein [Clostridia bacterium]
PRLDGLREKSLGIFLREEIREKREENRLKTQTACRLRFFNGQWKMDNREGRRFFIDNAGGV